MQKQKNRSNRIKISGEDWQDSVSFIRHHTDNGKTEAVIRNIEIEGSTATITLQPNGIEKTVTCEIDSSIKTDQKSSFEKFVEEQGFKPTEDNLLENMEGTQCNLNVYTNNNTIKFRISQTDEERPDRKDVIRDNMASLGFGYLLGALPVINFLILYIMHTEATTFEDKEFEYNRKNFYFITGIATSILFVYGTMLPVLLLT